MKGCNLPFVIINPFINPTTVPTIKAAITATNIF